MSKSKKKSSDGIDLRRVLLIVHPSQASARADLERMRSWFDSQDIQADILNLADHPESDELAAPDLDQLDLAVSLGGDGCVLRSVLLVGDADVPVLGVNHGRLGYLTEVESGDAIAALEKIQRGEYDIQQRMRLSVRLERGDGTSQHLSDVLNEVVLEKQHSGHTIQLSVWLDEEFFTTYVADGIIIATSTGSTAYSMSARGPIVAPSAEAILFTPVAPHMIFDRPLILPPRSVVRLEVLPDRIAETATDGRRQPNLVPGDSLVCERSPHPARLVSFSKRMFFDVLKQKFNLNDRVGGAG